jgi:hypothetical protein
VESNTEVTLKICINVFKMLEEDLNNSIRVKLDNFTKKRKLTPGGSGRKRLMIDRKRMKGRKGCGYELGNIKKIR